MTAPSQFDYPCRPPAHRGAKGRTLAGSLSLAGGRDGRGLRASTSELCVAGLLACLMLAACPPGANAAAPGDGTAADSGGAVAWKLRKRVETAPGTKRFHTVLEPAEWRAGETAVIVCDMWDLHHCLNATRRGAELAPRMNAFLTRARELGMTVIHAPSSCMEFYGDHPARRRALEVPLSKSLPEAIGEWCYQIPSEEQGEYPIDQSDGGEDDDPEEHAQWAKKLAAMGRNPKAPWKRQTDQLTIADQDFISDDGKQIWSILEQRKLSNVLLVGVHTNMCVLGRPFGLRQMAKNGKRVALVRDLTDTMYNPQRAPYVSHFTGTDYIVEHIEKWVCPTITSDQLLGGEPFRFKHDRRPHVVILMAEQEYETNETLPRFARQQLGKDYRVSLVFGDPEERNVLPHVEVVEQADLVLVSVRRRALPSSQLRIIRKFVESGKPVVGVRTANHAFSLRGMPAPAGHETWDAFDRDVIGGNYTGHHGSGKRVHVEAAPGASDHPILREVDAGKISGKGSLYKVSPLQKSATALLIGRIDGADPEPVAWVNTSKYGGRVFYTSLAHPGDLAQEEVAKLLRAAIDWAVKLPSKPR